MRTSSKYIDELSGIYNRRYLMEKKIGELMQLKEKKIPFSVAWVDLDHFKEVNDTYGHLKGDEIIKEFAQFLKNILRVSDTVVRYGGDEFVCIMPNTKRQDAEWIYRRILKRCKEREFSGLNVTISVGVASYPDEGKNFEELLRIADAALYDAKRSGRSRVGIVGEKRIELPIKVFIDRIGERDQLKNLLKDSKNRIEVAIVKGNVGIGKTRIVKEVLNHTRVKEIVWSDCLSFAENITYYSIGELLKYRIERKGKAILDDIPFVYRMEIGKLIPEVIEGIKNELEGVELVLDKYRFYESVSRVMGVGEKAKIVVLDNIQWIDKESTEVIKYLLRSLKHKSITFIFIYRTEELTELLEDFISYISRENKVREVELKPFKFNEIEECIKSIIGEEPERGLIEYMVRESGGNPFYIEEIMRELVEGSYFMVEEDRWRFREPEVEIVPKSIEDIAMRKYRSLSKEAQNVLEIASVVGFFDLEITKEITSYNEGHIIGLMEDISRAGMTKEVRGRIEFGEEICRNAIYKKNIEGLKEQVLHKKVGELIERRCDRKKREVMEELAFHYYRGREREKGIRYCIKAGDRAGEKYANIQAIKYYTWSLQLLGDEKEIDKVDIRIDCLFKRAKALSLIGDNESAMKDLERGLKESRRIGDKRREADILRKRARIYHDTTRCRESIKEAKKCRKICEEISDRKGIADILNVIALTHLDLTQYKKAMESFKKALGIFREMGDRVGVARVLNNIGIIYFELGEFRAAKKYFEDGLKIAREIDHKIFEGNMVGNIGNVYQEGGDYIKALKFYDKGLNISREIGHKGGEVKILANKSFMHTLLGEFRKALEFSEDALKISREIGDRNQEAGSLNGIGDIYYSMGDNNKAMKYYEEARRIIEQARTAVNDFYNLVCFGYIYLEMNKMEKAREFIEKAHKIAKEIDSGRIFSYVLILQCDYYLKKKELGMVKKFLGELSNLQKDLQQLTAEGQIKLISGRYHVENKDYSKAEEDFTTALRIFKKIKEKLSVGMVNYYIGEMELEKGERFRSKRYLNKSLKIFKSIGANGWKEKAEEAIKSLF